MAAAPSAAAPLAAASAAPSDSTQHDSMLRLDSPSNGGGHGSGHHSASQSPDDGLLRDNEPLLGEDGDGLTEEEREAQMQRRIEEGRKEEAKRESRKVVFLCFDLTHFSQTNLFILLSCGVLGFFMLNSWLEEFLFKRLRDFKFGWYMTAFELLCFAGFAALERRMKLSSPSDSIWQHNATYRQHLFVAFCMTCSRGLTNKSLEYLNYPTQVIFKSMKLITVMLGSLVILKQRFSVLEYVNAVALVLSAILFALGDTEAAPEVAGYTGIVIVCLSLVADALHSNTQEQLLKEFKAGVLEAMLYTNLFAAAMAGMWVLLTGEFFEAFVYCAEFPLAYLLFVLRASVIYLGVLCFVLMIGTFGVVSATAITTVRKILTIVASYVLFPKPWTGRHVLGGCIFAVGIALSVVDQKMKNAAKARQEREKAMQMTSVNGGGQRNNA